MSSNLKFINSYQPLGGGGCGDHIDAGGGGGDDVEDIDDDGGDSRVEGDAGSDGEMFRVTADRSEA